jgi:hypothetical protein
MKLNTKILLLITLVFIASVGIAVAEDATVAPYTFTVPDGYTIATASDTTCAMQKDNIHAVSFATEVGDDLELAKQGFVDKGYTLVGEQEIQYNDIQINLQAFSVEQGGTTLYTYNYVVLSQDGNFVVTVVTDDAEFNTDLNTATAEDNPAVTIFDTIQVN